MRKRGQPAAGTMAGAVFLYSKNAREGAFAVWEVIMGYYDLPRCGKCRPPLSRPAYNFITAFAEKKPKAGKNITWSHGPCRMSLQCGTNAAECPVPIEIAGIKAAGNSTIIGTLYDPKHCGEIKKVVKLPPYGLQFQTGKVPEKENGQWEQRTGMIR